MSHVDHGNKCPSDSLKTVPVTMISSDTLLARPKWMSAHSDRVASARFDRSRLPFEIATKMQIVSMGSENTLLMELGFKWREYGSK